jgi:NAD(P)H-dependent FMN reductase
MILAISGSANHNSSNNLLLHSLAKKFPQYNWLIYDKLSTMPLYQPFLDQSSPPEDVRVFRAKVAASQAIIISTPEYLHNIPAVLKNGLEWLKSSGELYDKAVLPITFTPRAPRGQYAMQSLVFSLQALHARIVAQLPLYKCDLEITGELYALKETHKTIFEEAISMLH